MVEVRTGRKDEARLLGEVLARAFADDPVIRWILPDGRGMTGMFVTLARHTHAAPGTAEIAYGENGPLGAALWDPPGYAASGWRTACAVVGFVRSMRGRVRYGQIVDDLLRKERPPSRTGTSPRSVRPNPARAWAAHCCAPVWSAATVSACPPISKAATK
ncbi:hypothetical protein ACFQHO_25285 [Actinomadura yumaensis]|uniref:hypothetical protein n=1 Tax=Actinomadura yumaensis TaxID=111807 RepID=UPI00361C628F